MENEVTKGSDGQNNNAILIRDSLYINSNNLGDIFYTSAYVDGLKKEIENLKSELLNIQKEKDTPIINKTVWASDDPIEKVLDNQHLNRVHELEEENKTLKFQLQELNQANVNLFNKNQSLELRNKNLQSLFDVSEFNLEGARNYTNDLVNKVKELEKELENKTKYVYEKTETRKVGQIIKSEVETQTYDECLQKQRLRIKELEELNSKLFNKNQELERKNKYISNEVKDGRKIHVLTINRDSVKNKIKELYEQLELKEIINQDLAKKYQLLQEEIDAYDINMLELVEKHSKLEQDYNDLQKQSSECNLRFQIERLTKKLDSHKENFKKYEQHIYIGDKILDIINKVDAQSYNIILTIKDRLISSVELNEFNQEKHDKELEKIKQLEQDYKELQGKYNKIEELKKKYITEDIEKKIQFVELFNNHSINFILEKSYKYLINPKVKSVSHEFQINAFTEKEIINRNEIIFKIELKNKEFK